MNDESNGAGQKSIVFGPVLITASVAAAIALAGWVISLETRMQRAITIVDERGPRLMNIERNIAELYSMVRDPSSRPETKVAIQSLRNDHSDMHQTIRRLEDRINNLHGFLQTSPALRQFQRRGDLEFRLDRVP